jgi:hypothetical protein
MHVARLIGKAQADSGRLMSCRRRSKEHLVDHGAVTLAIRTRLSERALPYGALRRRLGEYAGGGLCDGCGERITSAQASYAVDFPAGVTPQSVRLHRICFEIWQYESQTQLPESA